MIVVTGGAGFIGTNIVLELNRQGIDDIIVVDTLGTGAKIPNLSSLRIADFIDKEDFISRLSAGQRLGAIDGILHQGACSDTMVTDGAYVLKNNYEYSKILFEYCDRKKIRFVYASSASVYGSGTVFDEKVENEKPLNLYAYSKYMFDLYVRRRHLEGASPAVGLRYFNVYGPFEFHKQRMASVVVHFSRQLSQSGNVNLFEGSGGYNAGEQRRDFVHVEDAVKVNLHYLREDRVAGIFNVGTGQSRSFNDMATAVIDSWRAHPNLMNLADATTESMINYVDFPDALVGKYQSFTEANITRLRESGYSERMLDLESGVQRYVDWLSTQDGILLSA